MKISIQKKSNSRFKGRGATLPASGSKPPNQSRAPAWPPFHRAPPARAHECGKEEVREPLFLWLLAPSNHSQAWVGRRHSSLCGRRSFLSGTSRTTTTWPRPSGKTSWASSPALPHDRAVKRLKLALRRVAKKSPGIPAASLSLPAFDHLRQLAPGPIPQRSTPSGHD